jgi:N-acetylglutamate synthase-like GNAT family acetyltransferase
MPKAEWQIRQATRGDARAILHCLGQAFRPYRDEYTPLAFQDTVLTKKTVLDRLRTMTVLVAEAPSARIVGTIAFAVSRPGEGHLRGMAVLPEFQGSGVAGRLLSTAIVHLRTAGCHRATLGTTLPLRRASSFYERSGFRRTGKVSDFFGMALIEWARDLK